MCGRYVSVASTADLSEEFDVEAEPEDDLPPSWNVAPTDAVRLVVRRPPISDREAAPIRQLRTAQWGLVPSWAKARSGGAKMINARSETVATTRAYRTAAGRRRALAPALGYYEWQLDGGRRTPYLFEDPDRPILAMAALYEIWRDETRPADDPARWLLSCTIVTRPAVDAAGEIHERCPVLVPAELRAAWLDCTSGDPQDAERLLAEMPVPHLRPRRVGPAVGNVKNNGPQLIAPLDDAPQLD